MQAMPSYWYLLLAGQMSKIGGVGLGRFWFLGFRGV